MRQQRCEDHTSAARRNDISADDFIQTIVLPACADIAVVALADKNARLVWALLAHGRDYQAGYRSVKPIAA
jgi:hypothetical protein